MLGSFISTKGLRKERVHGADMVDDGLDGRDPRAIDPRTMSGGGDPRTLEQRGDRAMKEGVGHFGCAMDTLSPSRATQDGDILEDRE